jgi:hypothetical protein
MKYILYLDLHTISAKKRLRLLGQLIIISQISQLSDWRIYSYYIRRLILRSPQYNEVFG